MIKDEYEILAFNDLNVAHAYLDTMSGVLSSLRAEKSPLCGDLEKAYLGLSDFSYKYRYRLQDISAIAGKIEEARIKHRSTRAKNSELEKLNSQLTKQLENSRALCLELQSDNEELKRMVNELKENLKLFLPL